MLRRFVIFVLAAGAGALIWLRREQLGYAIAERLSDHDWDDVEDDEDDEDLAWPLNPAV